MVFSNAQGRPPGFRKSLSIANLRRALVFSTDGYDHNRRAGVDARPVLAI